MDQLDPGTRPKATVVDPVCGMKVDPATTKFSHAHGGKNFYFCCGGCREKFMASPERFLSTAPKGMGSGLVTLGMPAAAGTGGGTRRSIYVCPMCLEVRQVGPGPCPKCGMALEPESPAPPPTETEYTCPMHPEIVRREPGNCPICGMALEPRTVTLLSLIHI